MSRFEHAQLQMDAKLAIGRQLVIESDPRTVRHLTKLAEAVKKDHRTDTGLRDIITRCNGEIIKPRQGGWGWVLVWIVAEFAYALFTVIFLPRTASIIWDIPTFVLTFFWVLAMWRAMGNSRRMTAYRIAADKRSWEVSDERHEQEKVIKAEGWDQIGGVPISEWIKAQDLDAINKLYQRQLDTEEKQLRKAELVSTRVSAQAVTSPPRHEEFCDCCGSSEAKAKYAKVLAYHEAQMRAAGVPLHNPREMSEWKRRKTAAGVSLREQHAAIKAAMADPKNLVTLAMSKPERFSCVHCGTATNYKMCDNCRMEATWSSSTSGTYVLPAPMTVTPVTPSFPVQTVPIYDPDSRKYLGAVTKVTGPDGDSWVPTPDLAEIVNNPEIMDTERK